MSIRRMQTNKFTTAFIVIALMAAQGCMSLEERLASDDCETRKSAESELYTSAIRTGKEGEVLSAVKRITCDELLAAIAISENPESITRGAVEKMTDEKWLSSVAVHSKVPEIQAIAIGKLKNQALVLEVYNLVKSDALKMKAVERMDSESVAKIPYTPMLAARWRDIKNQDILAEIISRDLSKIDETAWNELMSRITHGAIKKKVQRSLAYVYAEQFDSLSDDAKKCLVANIDDKEIIEEMITKPDRYEIRRAEEKRKRDIERIERAIKREEDEVKRWQHFVESSKSKMHFLDAKRHQKEVDEHKSLLIKRKEELQAIVAARPRKIFVEDVTARIPLYEKLGDDNLTRILKIKMKDLGSFHNAEIEQWEECQAIVSALKDVAERKRYYMCFLSEIIDDEVKADGKSGSVLGFSYTNHKWNTVDKERAQHFVDKWEIGKTPELLEQMLSSNASGCKYLLKYATPGLLVKLLKSKKLTSPSLQKLAVQKIDSEFIDVELYKAIKDDAVRKVILAKMPTSLREVVEQY